jgi:hypothetical protein
VDSLAPIIQGFWLGSSSLDPSQPGGAYLSAALRFSDDLSGSLASLPLVTTLSASASAPAPRVRLGLCISVPTTYKDPPWLALSMPPENLIPSSLLVAGLWIPFSSGIKQVTLSTNPPLPPTGPPSSAPAASPKPPFRSPMGPIQLREPGPTPSPPASKAFRSTPPALIPPSQVALTFPLR